MILGYWGSTQPPDTRGLSEVRLGEVIFACTDSEETGIFNDPERNLIFVAEGRIDNREELCSKLGFCGSDPQYMFQAFLTWGAACVAHLLGDWTIAAYQASSRQFFLARDRSGASSFFYKNGIREFRFSTSAQVISRAGHAPNVRYLAAVLCNWRYRSKNSETAFEGINRLSPGYMLTCQDGTVRVKKYWFPEHIALKHYPRAKDYSDELLEITREAVRCRIPDTGPVASMLSGGLDSSTISLLVADVLGVSPLVTFSHVPLYAPDPAVSASRFTDESEHIDAVVAAAGNIRSVKFRSAHISPLDGIERFIDGFQTVVHAAANCFWLVDMLEQASASGFKVLFSGAAGNAALSFKGVAALQRKYAGLKGRLSNQVIRPALTHILEYRRFRQISRSTFVNPQVYRDLHIDYDVLVHRTGGKQQFRNAAGHMLDIVHMRHNGQLFADSVYKTRVLDPTLDSRILEHCLAIPNPFFFNEKGQGREVVRRMMAGRLPDKVLYERRKGLQASDIATRLKADTDRLEAYALLFEKNPLFRYLIDTSRVHHAIGLLKTDRLDRAGISNLLKTVMLGVFLEKNRF